MCSISQTANKCLVCGTMTRGVLWEEALAMRTASVDTQQKALTALMARFSLSVNESVHEIRNISTTCL